ncbi:hypothetical protein GCM10025865_08000 [Paraoerskovia sediminicola]|uniref:Tight adherence protein B n=1 Tax=Paraoerskovia sediminicola TaxID=1138587 RepID=A0ABM8G0R3_9CELL|nr:type II secretion system F family protein [Paraoerskovia sediminicola]BDZ41501.1 hypothetical protein GCM10025865_08000 [Paraoerskovia sediminicola]
MSDAGGRAGLRGRWRRAGAASAGRPAADLAGVGAHLRAGRSVRESWELGAGVRCSADGVPDVPELCAVWVGVESRRHVAPVVAASRVAGDVGAPVAEVLEAVARSLAAGDEARGDRDAALAGPLTTVRLLVCLPVVGIGLGALLGADPVGVLLDGGVGSLALGGGVLCTVTGAGWARRLVRSAREAGAEP